MPVPRRLLSDFEENTFFHVICKSIEKRKLFQTDFDKLFFLQRYVDFITGFADTYAYNLLTNHVHLLIHVKSISEIVENLSHYNPKELTRTQSKFLNGNKDELLHELIEQQFNRLCISYARTYNIKKNESGHLFLRPFKRVAVENDFHLTQLMVYIHANSIKHGISADFTNDKWSSYRSILSSFPTFIERDKVLNWFGNRENFIKTHKEQIGYYYENQYSIE